MEDVAYFQCQPLHGLFVRPEKLDVGDFPPVDLLDGEDPDEEM